jgi:S-disulfanyl-L-cysteine oxidoreductase SoxD
MFNCLKALPLLAGCLAAQAQPFTGIGRAATAAEVRAWDTDVRPDFKGLPPGSGSVERGMQVWEAQCASCHGVFGEANHVFTPLIGGTTASDVQSGRVARLTDPAFPGRTTLMKLPTLATLWDYIHRAMPWNAPKSLSVDDVYAVTAYMLNLGGVVASDFTLSERNVADVQQRLPNRRGMTLAHALWPGGLPGSHKMPDVRAPACMSQCKTDTTVVSRIPDYARDAHGNLAEQNRLVGPQRGIVTAAAAAPAAAPPAPALALAKQHNCLACHGVDNAAVGPGLREVARKYAGRSDAAEHLAQRIASGGSGVWGAVPMPAQSLPAEDAETLAAWIAGGAK